MTYSPLAQSVRCTGCGRTFIQGNIECAVMHSHGTCCHCSDTEICPKCGTSGCLEDKRIDF